MNTYLSIQFLPVEPDNSGLDMDTIMDERDIAVAAIDDSATESDPDYPVATMSAAAALELIAKTPAKVSKQRGKLRDQIDAMQSREIYEEGKSDPDFDYMNVEVEMEVETDRGTKRKADLEVTP